MAAQGRTYKQILAFYYPGTVLGVTAEGLSWQTLGGERVQVMSVRPQQDRPLVGLGDRLARAAEDRLGRQFPQPPKLKVYPTIDAFRDATGEPGWVAASTRGNVIRLQPIAALRARDSLDRTILHELLHALIESRANRRLPIWFSEGAAAYFATDTKGNASVPSPPEDNAFLRTPEEARRAYAAARDCFAFLASRFGEPTVFGWLERGLPPEATQALARR